MRRWKRIHFVVYEYVLGPETLFLWEEPLILFTGSHVCGLLSWKIVLSRLYFLMKCKLKYAFFSWLKKMTSRSNQENNRNPFSKLYLKKTYLRNEFIVCWAVFPNFIDGDTLFAGVLGGRKTWNFMSMGRTINIIYRGPRKSWGKGKGGVEYIFWFTHRFCSLRLNFWNKALRNFMHGGVINPNWSNCATLLTGGLWIWC